MNYDVALEIKGLSKNYDGFKLESIDLTLPGGCIMGLVGENGAGKTTTIKAILDLIHKDAGEIKIFNHDTSVHLKDLKENIGVVLDESFFPEALNATGVDGIMKNVYKTWNSKEYHEWGAKFDLPLKKTFKDYSRGMKMKHAIAVALSHDSKLLILDEATSGLDPMVRDEILDVFLEFIQDPTHSIFISSHIISDLEKICDYIAFIHKGKLVFSEPKDELLDKYGIIKCSDDFIDTLPKDKVIGVRKNNFGVEALVMRDGISKAMLQEEKMTMDKATIEDIMLYYHKRR
ncbi:ABC transporter ATP-binding protein [Fusibacter bizertensis]|uniref:ABC transporter ATP-binding protein n=1 Tax=Fusibacter bizertensis TaxID=1488331 RepID=A0ABT6NCR0_9FIRM|nr:ABC transporter ATP-binding protein [Fusibacter bizertensis]MDH8678201.1 ABC transporter ATP-binding protein [Fusibacter bizertensis]